MRMEQIREIANAVLYEGYLLYPYRRSAIKNQRRWTFGVVYPRAYGEMRGETDPWTMRTECLVLSEGNTTLDVTVRFLHLLARTTRRVGTAEVWGLPKAGVANGSTDTWEEAIEREVSAPTVSLHELVERPRRIDIAFPAERHEERAPGAVGIAERAIVREQRAVAGAMVLAAVPVDGAGAPAYSVSVRIENTTPLAGSDSLQYGAALLQSFVSTHTLLRVSRGAFVSLLDPPEALAEAASACRNEHTWPVLVGDEGDRDTLLSSPIILYDYPRIAPESPGALFDGTEIDELLTLRILALTDEEKEEMRQSDDRAREILERTEALSMEQLLKMHGVIRSLGSAEEGSGT